LKVNNLNEYYALIILPVKPNNFTIRSIKFLKEILNESFATPKKILKKKEYEILDLITNNPCELIIKRNFNLLINDQFINISDMVHISNDEKLNIENYLKDIKDKIKTLNLSGKYTDLIFEYNISYINKENSTT